MNLIIRKASVCWKGGGKGSSMEVMTDSGVLKQVPFTPRDKWKSAFDPIPIELIAAAHATSFSLALSNELRLGSSAAGEIFTTATVALENLAVGWTIVNVHLNVVGRILKITQRKFIDATVRAKTKCLISGALKASVSIHTKLEKAVVRARGGRKDQPGLSKAGRRGLRRAAQERSGPPLIPGRVTDAH